MYARVTLYGHLFFEAEPSRKRHGFRVRSVRPGLASIYLYPGLYRVREALLNALAKRSVRLLNQRLANQPDAEKQSHHVDEHVGTDGIRFQIVKQRISEPLPARAGCICLNRRLLPLPRRFMDGERGLEQHRAERQPIGAVKGLVAHWNTEETCEPECFVWSLRLNMPSKRLGPRIDAKN